MIFPNEKIIYVPIMKTATVSMRTYLREIMDEGYQTTHEQIEEFGHPDHPTLRQCHAKIIANNDDPAAYRSFSFVRNPWSHMYSVYKYAKNTDAFSGTWADWMLEIRFNYWSTNLWKHHKFKGFTDRLESPYGNIGYVGTLEDFETHFKEVKKYCLQTSIDRISNQAKKYSDLRLPNPINPKLDLDYLEWKDRLDVILEGPKHLNKTTENRLEYLENYTDQHVKIVSSIYSQDISNFGYKFGH